MHLSAEWAPLLYEHNYSMGTSVLWTDLYENTHDLDTSLARAYLWTFPSVPWHISVTLWHGQLCERHFYTMKFLYQDNYLPCRNPDSPSNHKNLPDFTAQLMPFFPRVLKARSIQTAQPFLLTPAWKKRPLTQNYADTKTTQGFNIHAPTQLYTQLHRHKIYTRESTYIHLYTHAQHTYTITYMHTHSANRNKDTYTHAYTNAQYYNFFIRAKYFEEGLRHTAAFNNCSNVNSQAQRRTCFSGSHSPRYCWRYELHVQNISCNKSVRDG